MVLELEQDRKAAAELWSDLCVAWVETELRSEVLGDDVVPVWESFVSVSQVIFVHDREYILCTPKESHASSTSLPGGKRNNELFGFENEPSN